MTRQEILDRIGPAVRQAYPAHGRALVRAAERALWGWRHDPGLKGAHCVWCGRHHADVLLFVGLFCAHCIGVARMQLIEEKVGAHAPGWDLAFAEIARALRATDPDSPSAEEVLAALASHMLARPRGDRGPPLACLRCGPKDEWPREERPDERCALCWKQRPEVARLVVGPTNVLCEACVERCWNAIPPADRQALAGGG